MKHSVAERIRYKLEEQNLSVLGLEKKAGLKVHAVQNILTGHSKKPNIDTLLAIAGALGCSLNDLIDEQAHRGPSLQTKVDKFTNLSLLAEVTSYLISEATKLTSEISPQTLSDYTQEVYLYCEKTKGGVLDTDFASWVLDRLRFE